MYADRRSARHGLDPRSATIALVVNGAVVAALIFAAPEVVNIHHDHPITLVDVPIAPPPKLLPPSKPLDRANPAPHPVIAPIPVVPTIPTTDPVAFTFPPMPAATSDGTGIAIGIATATPTPTPTPALVGPQLDPRYARDLQPDYPAEETRAAREGRVVVRVLIGIDGRVRQVERTSATSDAFWRATQRQALAHWRFSPGDPRRRARRGVADDGDQFRAARIACPVGAGLV